jgi:hypothetical protein
MSKFLYFSCFLLVFSLMLGLFCTYHQHAITKLKHIVQAKSRKGVVKETRTEVHVASASLSPCSGLPYSHSISTKTQYKTSQA